jgi:hypothetical protein
LYILSSGSCRGEEGEKDRGGKILHPREINGLGYQSGSVLPALNKYFSARSAKKNPPLANVNCKNYVRIIMKNKQKQD